MHRKKIFAVVTIVAMILLMASSALSSISPPLGDQSLPKLDEILYKMYPGATVDTVVEEFLTEVTQFIRGPYRSDLHQDVVDDGHTVSTMDPMAEFGAIAINCRDYKVTSLEENLPLNNSAFRIALSYIYDSFDRKAEITSERIVRIKTDHPDTWKEETLPIGELVPTPGTSSNPVEFGDVAKNDTEEISLLLRNDGEDCLVVKRIENSTHFQVIGFEEFSSLVIILQFSF